MPQMMPINWLIIFMMCLMSLLIMMFLINSLLIFLKIKKKSNIIYYKKWKWMW
nr:TPA_asm: ATP8 [Bombus haemorrhoidalis]